MLCECVRGPLLLSPYFTEAYVSLWCPSVASTRVTELFKVIADQIIDWSFKERNMFVVSKEVPFFTLESGESSNQSDVLIIFNIALAQGTGAHPLT